MKVRIVNNSSDLSIRDKYVGEVGEMISKTSFLGGTYYSVKFDDEQLQRQNITEGSWLWREQEFIEEINCSNKDEIVKMFYDKYDTIINGNEKLIINYPCVICILRDGDKVYKGIAKLLEGDVWNKNRGIAIARKKVEIKKCEYELKQLCRL